MRIGIDIMGGDFFPAAPVDGAVRVLKNPNGKVQPVLIGNSSVIEEELKKHGVSIDQFEVIHTEDYIDMADKPSRSISQKTKATINIGIQMVKEGKIDGFVSAGNTGAMLVASIFGLGTIPGVSRPTIGILFPNHENKLSLLCDVGANVDCKPEHLKHFAILGSIYMGEVLKTSNPKVALVNIGEEDSKGPQAVQAAHSLLRETPSINFIGNVEGRDLYAGLADVYVCDGFVGNIVLKFGESLYDVLKEKYSTDDFIETFNFENYGGVPVLGIKGISIIGHGISTGKAIENMVWRAAAAVESDLIKKIEAEFAGIATGE